MYASELDDFPPMTEAEYLAFADEQEMKYEYRAGEVLAMSGGTVNHGIIAMNSGTHLNIKLGDRDCTVTSSDVRVYIAHKQTYRYPDVTVFCGEPGYLGDRRDTLTNPVLLVEVLSPGTSATDRGDKLDEYMAIESLEAYVLVSQDEPKVEVYQRHTGGKWLYEKAKGLDAEIAAPLPGGEVELSLAALYQRVRWEEVETNDTNDTETQAGDQPHDN